MELRNASQRGLESFVVVVVVVYIYFRTNISLRLEHAVLGTHISAVYL